MRVAILHISDLHRDLHDEIETASLLDSLERDLSRHGSEAPPILGPALCVVSGDLIYGASPSAVAPDTELERQYQQAHEFLCGLADRFFGGDRNRVVILPGNHDVSFPSVMRCVEAIPIPEDNGTKKSLVTELFSPRSKLRWSWQELCFYRISDEDAYHSRVKQFADLYYGFYKGNRIFSLNPERQFDVFDFPDLGLSILSMSSCFNNDPFRRAGAFHPTVVTQACRLARDPKRAGWLVAAAWHHNLTGGPAQDDYIDSGVLQLLIDSGISLALHGHQHLTELLEERYRVGPTSRKLAIVSAGTLCAGPHHLAPGEPRSFNLIELDLQQWSGRVHQRTMVNRTYNLPIWGPGHFNTSNQSFLDFQLSPPLTSRPKDLDVDIAIECAERELGTGRWLEAVNILRPLAQVPVARPLLSRALFEHGDPGLTIELLTPPISTSEAVQVGWAIYECGTREHAERFLSHPFVRETTDASVREIARRVREKRSQ